MFIKKLIGTFVVNLVGCFAATIGMFAGIVVWSNGAYDWVEEKTKRVFNR